MSKKEVMDIAKKHGVVGFYGGLFRKIGVNRANSKIFKQAERAVKKYDKSDKVLAVMEYHRRIGVPGEELFRCVISEKKPTKVYKNQYNGDHGYTLYEYDAGNDLFLRVSYHLSFEQLTELLNAKYNDGVFDYTKRGSFK